MKQIAEKDRKELEAKLENVLQEKIDQIADRIA